MVALLASLLACSRSPKPSPDYERARSLWTTVVVERGMDAGDDPRAEEVLALLDRVPNESPDAAAAADIRSRISSLRKDSEAERERRARVLGRLDGSTGAQPSEDTSGAAAPGRPALAMGMKLEEFRVACGECVEPKGPVKLEAAGGAHRDGEMWVLKDGDDCRARHPQLVDRAAVFVGGALASLSPLSSMRTVEVRRQVELAPLPGGGQGMVVDGKVVPLPPGSKVGQGDEVGGGSGAEPATSKPASPAAASGASESAEGAAGSAR
jgi:hypothetical protein